jgi:hypothetical protein
MRAAINATGSNLFVKIIALLLLAKVKYFPIRRAVGHAARAIPSMSGV